jgi:hypothetical protein
VFVMGTVGRLGDRREQGEDESEKQAHAGWAVQGTA